MRKQASDEKIGRWKEDYLQLRKKQTNKEIAEKLGVDAGYLSKIARGAKDKDGVPKNAGEEFINRFYECYPEFIKISKGNKSEVGPKEEKPYRQDPFPSSEAAEAQVRYLINWEDPVMVRNELFQVYKKNDDHLRGELTKIVDIHQTTVNSVYKMAESTLILSQEVALYRKQAIPDQDNASQQS